MRPLFCRKCGNRLTNEKALFCEKCGTRIEEVEDTLADKATSEVVEPKKSVEENITASNAETQEAEATQKEKKTMATWMVALITVVVLLIVTGIGVMSMYFNHSILPSINPWAATENVEADESDELVLDSNEADESGDLVEDSISEDTDDGLAVSVEQEASLENEDGSGIEEDTATITEDRPYVAGDDTGRLELHRYEIFMDDVDWETAREYAAAMGENAYLLHINTQEEYDYISDILKNNYSGCIFWIGAKREKDSYVYKWVNALGDYVGNNLTGIIFWLANEPSFYDVSITSNEDCVNFFYSKAEGRYVMNDVPGNILDYVPSYSGKIGYIVEIED